MLGLMGERVIGVDLAKVYAPGPRGALLTTLAWGDRVQVLEERKDKIRVRVRLLRELGDGSLEPVATEGEIRPKSAEVLIKPSASKILKVDFVDVQQGDGAVVETPQGKVVLVDGGDNQLFARYLAGRFPGTSHDKPKEIDCIVVSHGDADHFQGLTEIYRSEQNETDWKRLFIHPARVFHNGLVKGEGKDASGKTRKDAVMFGATEPAEAKAGQPLIVTGLETNLLRVPASKMNEPFREWKDALKRFAQRGPIAFRRLAQGDGSAFDFLEPEGISVEVLGPLLTELNGKKGLKFLGEPRRRFGHPSENQTTFSGLSASHTINGQSIVFRLNYGDFHFLFAGDLNEEAELGLVDRHKRGEVNLRSEVLKVPHHGSEDFEPSFLDAVEAVVSVVSSGDDDKEYIHPRATLMSALGRAGRFALPVVFVTELVAFFKAVGWVPLPPSKQQADTEHGDSFFAFARKAFGIVRIRTDGDRLLVFTNSGQESKKEAYAYKLDADKVTDRGGRVAVPQKVVAV